jgi:hypothetical protein
VHGTGVYSARVGPKGPALERFLDIKKKRALKQSLLVALRSIDPNARKRPKMGQVMHILQAEDT